MKNIKKVSRRRFIAGSTLAAAGVTIVPRHVLGKGYLAPSDTLNVAGVGAGGKGSSDVREIYGDGKTNIVALVDVDDERAADTFTKFPKAKRYKDYRVMLDKQKDIDAVIVSTPDNLHAVVAMAAMESGKHVYVQKPLTHDIHEARMLTEAAKKYNVKTQMGNQGASGEGTQLVLEWIDSGIIGPVTKVHAWTNRPIWPQGIPTPSGDFKVPKTLDWNLWLGPAPMRDYHPDYLPFKWRGWWDFGTGALGDMACHIVDPAFRALKMGHPISVEASVANIYTGFYPDSCPPASKIVFEYPERGNLPPVTMVWYDGGILPDRPQELGPDDAMGNWDGGLIFEGSKGKLMTDCYGANPRLLPLSMNSLVNNPPQKYRRVEEGHYQNWVRSCKGEIEKASSDFEIAGPLTETILIGNLALRSYFYQELKPGKKEGDWQAHNYPGRKKLMWDADNLRVTNFEGANQYVKRDYRKF